MLPQGFLGTRGDILMDLVVLSFIVILPVLVISWRAARAGNFSRHRAIQLTLVWFPLLVLSLRRFPSPPASNDFGATHRACGRVGMMLMMASGISAVPLYYVGFAL